MTVTEETINIATPTGDMRTYLFRPAASGKYPCIILFSEIFQVTGPIRRTATLLASHGYIVCAPEIYHDFVPAGTVFAYDPEGGEKGNTLKTTKEVAAFDADTRAVIHHLQSRADTTGRIGAIGFCIGGHLTFRAAMNREILAAACFYATDIHKHSLGAGMNDNSLTRAAEIKGELLHVWGRQDPHVPLDGRNIVHARLEEAGVNFQWLEINAAHAFLRDEGARYDPALGFLALDFALDLFHRRLAI